MTDALHFHELKVETVERLTADAVAIGLEVPAQIAHEFVHIPGQHVTVRAFIGGEDIRRSYSICTPPSPGRLRIGVKQLAGGAFSTHANTALAPGDTLEVMPPVGEFTVKPDPDAVHRYVALAAGSGITPVLSMIASTLAAEPGTNWTLMYGNRNARSVMFLDELEGLKDRYPTRLQIIHVLSREDTGLELTTGRIDAERLRLLFGQLVRPETVDRFFLCGPFDMVMALRAELLAVGIEEDAIAEELFFSGPPDPLSMPTPPGDTEGAVKLTLTLDGRRTVTTMLPETTVLDAALAVRSELPYSCRGGMCATCKARVIEGAVQMDKNYALIPEDLEAGFVLTCQAHPQTDHIVIDYDQR